MPDPEELREHLTQLLLRIDLPLVNRMAEELLDVGERYGEHTTQEFCVALARALGGMIHATTDTAAQRDHIALVLGVALTDVMHQATEDDGGFPETPAGGGKP